ncbi:hypothetical protein SXCC_03643 [Gluconacetobacter sp. SXCC-1]|nr:hypothetical protein SXCC_03643 [Gluconacetobacter sp. SXCC-1]
MIRSLGFVLDMLRLYGLRCRKYPEQVTLRHIVRFSSRMSTTRNNHHPFPHERIEYAYCIYRKIL